MMSIFCIILIVGISYVILAPIIGIVARSFFSDSDAINPIVFTIPMNPTLERYERAIVHLRYWSTSLNTLIYTIALTLIQVLVCSMVGYGFARFAFPFKKVLFASYSGALSSDMQFENVKKLEERYNITYEFQNLTYSGIQESINTSILAGAPDCDLYQVDLSWAAAAVLNGYAIDLRDILPVDDPLLTHQDPYLNWVDVGNGAVSLLYPNSAEDTVANTNPLAFNLQMIQDAGLEDPRELVARGEWTWDKFREYCLALTKGLDGDGVTDQYGFAGWTEDVFKQLIMSNGAAIAPFGSTEEQLTSAATGEVLQFMQDLYLNDKVWKPIPDENGWDIARYEWRTDTVAFSHIAVWVMAENKDYSGDNPLPYDMVFIPWPVGPSGNADTNPGKMVAGNYWMIPTGIEDPLMLYNFFRDYCNWYQGDIELRDDPETLHWWYESTAKDVELQDANFAVLQQIGSRIQADNMSNLGEDATLPLLDLLKGDYTVAQLQETYKQPVTDAMIRLSGN